MEKEKNFISAVVYVHNNEKEIEKFLSQINRVLYEKFEKYEIICVNDCSTDQSVKEIRDYAGKVSGIVISILNMSFYQGRELAMNAGVDLAIGDFVYEFDSAVIEYPIELMLQLYEESLKGYDIVSAVPDIPMKRSSKLFYQIFNRFSAVQYKLETEAFRIISRRGINRVHSMSRTIPYRKAMYARCGLRYSKVLYHASERKKREHEPKKMREELAIDSFILFTDIAYRFTMLMMALMLIAIMGVGIYTIIVFAAGDPVAGWTTTMLFLGFCFFGIFAVLAIMLKYMSLIVSLLFNKQKYLFESIEKLTR